MAVGAGGRVIPDAVNTVPSATAVGKAFTTSDVDEDEEDNTVEEGEDDERDVEVEEREMMIIGLTLLLVGDTTGFGEAIVGFDEGDEGDVGLVELLVTLLELETL